MVNYNNRHRPNQSYARQKFNDKVNRIKKVNTIHNQRGGIKL